MKHMIRIFWASLVALALPVAAWAEEAATEAAEAATAAPAIDAGDTAWILVSTALVMLMTPGLALFYGGMVRKKNVLNTIMMSVVMLGLVSIQWVLFGYSLSFGSDVSGLIGDLSFLGFEGVTGDPTTLTIPHSLFAMFQLMFAILTVAIISGSIAERMRFPAFILFALLWTTVVYDPLAHMVWGGGWLFQLGALDFAGGTVVHISSGISGLVLALVLGKRKGFGSEAMPPHNLPMTLLGGALLWFGWFGFNAGSALAANGLAASAFTTTQVAAGAGLLGWIIAEWMKYGKPTMLGAISGGIAGLVAITPAAGFVTPLSAVFIGLVGGALCYFGVAVLKAKLGYDDSLDAFGIHGIGGTWGALATGIWTTTTVNSAGKDGLFYTGAFDVVTNQMIAVVATYVIAAVATYIIIKIVGLFTEVRADASEETSGLDVANHGEIAYPDSESTGVAAPDFLSAVPSPAAVAEPKNA